jgi:hypothetical protein
MSERPKEPDSKSGVPVRVPRVRIPLSPPSWYSPVFAEAVTFTVDCKTGRLVEGRPYGLRTVDDVTHYQEMRRSVAARVGRAVVHCADWRASDSFPPDVGDRMLSLVAGHTPGFERIALLVAREQARFNLAVERAARAAGDASRRVFRDVAELKAWLSGALDAPERARLDEFLREMPPRSPSSMRMPVVRR